MANTHKFTGKELDSETGLYYFGASYYDPGIGRFLSVDPLADRHPQWSPYVYALNNPLRLIDPTGMQPEEEKKKKSLLQRLGEWASRQLSKIGINPGGMPPTHIDTQGAAKEVVGEGDAQEAVEAIAMGSQTGETPKPDLEKILLYKSLASQQQMGEEGITIAGKGAKREFRDVQIVANTYGGKSGDWVKKTSTSYKLPDGSRIETHWVENLKTGQREEYKTILVPAKQ